MRNDLRNYRRPSCAEVRRDRTEMIVVDSLAIMTIETPTFLRRDSTLNVVRPAILSLLGSYVGIIRPTMNYLKKYVYVHMRRCSNDDFS